MNALLALTIALAGTNAVLRCVTPGAGSFYVECSTDALRWRVVASGYVAEACHVAVTEACAGTIKLYRVEWREIGK